jgi:dCTP deaminase
LILSSSEIVRRRAAGDIVVDPWCDAHLGPNSVDLTLSPTLLTYRGRTLDARQDNATDELTIPERGLVLLPGRLYLGATAEWTETRGNLVPFIEGRSSLARLGVSTHCSAGFGDHAFAGSWTLELTVVHPVRLYAGMRVCQIAWLTMQGKPVMEYVGRYQGQRGPVASRLWRDGGKGAGE